jgi:hypothetical protein
VGVDTVACTRVSLRVCSLLYYIESITCQDIIDIHYPRLDLTGALSERSHGADFLIHPPLRPGPLSHVNFPYHEFISNRTRLERFFPLMPGTVLRIP